MYPFFTSEDEQLVRCLKESVRAICGTSGATELWSISSEAGYFSTVAGLPVVAFGPGEDRFTHNQEEHVRVEDLVLSAKVFAAMILKRCVDIAAV
jgi:acetylornithine deacetylase/succinyl-diaminopimelate desuccinylase-like protein